jgi:hypothetical protein
LVSTGFVFLSSDAGGLAGRKLGQTHFFCRKILRRREDGTLQAVSFCDGRSDHASEVEGCQSDIFGGWSYPHDSSVPEGNCFIIERCARRRRGNPTYLFEQKRGTEC